MEPSSAPRSVPLEPFTAGGVTGDISPGGAATGGKTGEKFKIHTFLERNHGANRWHLAINCKVN